MRCEIAGRWIAGVVLAGALAGCAGEKPAAPATVLRSEDFIADPATMPTELPPASTHAPVEARESAPPAQVAAMPQPEFKDVVIEQGPPPMASAPESTPVELATLIDAKIGEINGKAIRVDDVFREHGQRLGRLATKRELSTEEWIAIRMIPPDPPRSINRQEWLAFVDYLMRAHLYNILRDELLAAEARASLKPERRMGLRAFVAETKEVKRRSVGGSRAELERQLRAQNQDEQRFGKKVESELLIDMQLQERIRNRYRASWTDVKRYYNRNVNLYQQPAKAKFRRIIVPLENAEGAALIRRELEAGKAFEDVARNAVNTYNPDDGGLFGDGATDIGGPIETATPFASDELNRAAQGLSPGKFSKEPVELTERSGAKTLNWLYLESIEGGGKQLSDPDVQMSIVRRLNGQAFEVGMSAYIESLMNRATYTDLDEMARRLVGIAADRYWPSGG